jgi:hypothetical protein
VIAWAQPVSFLSLAVAFGHKKQEESRGESDLG